MNQQSKAPHTPPPVQMVAKSGAHASTDVTINLARALGLQPLDRVQVNSAREIEEMRSDMHFTGEGDLPFCFFQRVLERGLIEVRNPAGRVLVVSPHDICDVRRGTQVLVNAMPQPVFLERLKLSNGRRAAAGPECYALAHVLYAEKSRSGAVTAYVWFCDDALNTTGRPWPGPLTEADRRAFLSVARRTLMPISDSRSSGAYSADANIKQEQRRDRSVTSAFLACALRGDVDGATVAASDGIRAVSRAVLGRLAQQ